MSTSSTESPSPPSRSLRRANRQDPAGRGPGRGDRGRPSPCRASVDAERLARALHADEIEAGHAVLVGNLAGVVEWTDDAWVRLTGFPLEETLGKPISHFLDRVGLERELVDFVAQHFLDGRPCTIELPFDRCDGRRLHVRLAVEPSTGAADGATRFVAVARALADPAPPGTTGDGDGDGDELDAIGPADTTETDPARNGSRARGKAEVDASAADRALPTADASVVATTRVSDLNRGLQSAIERLRPRLADSSLFEVIPEPGRLAVACSPDRLARLLAAIVDAVDPAAPFVSALTGRLGAGRSHHSAVHPIPARRCAQRRQDGAYLELHDTGPHLARAALDRLARGRPGDDPRERALDRARRCAEAAGADWLLDSTPGCGTQQLVVFDAS